MKIYNTMTKKKEEFKPETEGLVRIYVCGPTVYDHSHIGHGRTYVVYDVLERYLRYLGYDVEKAINITDIDKTYLRQEFGSWIETVEDLREFAQRLGELYHEKKYKDAIDELERLLPPNLSRRELISEYIRETLNVLNKAMEMIR